MKSAEVTPPRGNPDPFNQRRTLERGVRGKVTTEHRYLHMDLEDRALSGTPQAQAFANSRQQVRPIRADVSQIRYDDGLA
jgi:hypothetical protein